jgi:hypothetical protein
MRNVLSVIFLLAFASAVFAKPAVTIKTPLKVPTWAVKEREVLDRNAVMVRSFADKYVDQKTGRLECVEHWGGGDGPDDAMENFYNWPMIYVLGGDASTLDLFKFIWNGHIKQYTSLGMYYREFIPSFDWEHNGEGIQPFLTLPLADPNDQLTKDRIVRFADFYTGRDTTVTNYDPVHKIIRSILNGSKGPKYDPTMQYWSGRDEYIEFWKDWIEVPTAGDVPMNFHATSLAANAFILTGDPHYRNWINEYMGAWRDRTVANRGNVPSIVGLNGIVGEGWDGAWYGGLMGWNWKFGGWGILGRGVRVGFLNAFYMTGDPSFLGALRMQGANLLANSDKGYHSKYGPKGWYGSDGGALWEGLYSDLYQASLDQKDANDLSKAANLDSSRRRNDRIWKYEYEAGRYEGGNEVVWFDFLNGTYPGYPDKALDDALDRISFNLKGIAEDQSTPDKRQADTPHIIRTTPEAPLGIIGSVIGALTNLTMGGSAPIWTGGLLWCQLRYFDPIKKRPGLPQDTAALVTAIKPESVSVTLVNMNQKEKRTMIVQTGAYGEHQCSQVEYGGKRVKVNARYFTVELAPGAGGELVIYRSRNVNQPTFAFPWQNTAGKTK